MYNTHLITDNPIAAHLGTEEVLFFGTSLRYQRVACRFILEGSLWWGQRVVVSLCSIHEKLFCFTGEWVFMHAAHSGWGVSALLRTRCAGWCDSRGTIGNNGTNTVLLPAANQIRHRPRDAKQRLFMRMPDK